MHKQARLVFNGEEVRKLVEDSRQATLRVRPYAGKAADVPIGLLLVKDDGIYLLSNAVRKAPPKTSGLISYANGYGSLDDAPDRGERYEKILEAVGGDDFCEAVPWTPLMERALLPGMNLILLLSKDKISYRIERRGREAS